MSSNVQESDDFTPATEAKQTLPPNPELRFEFSPSIGKLIEALAKASLTFKPVIKDSTNPFFKSKYADLAAVIDATRDSLGKNGLAVLQPVIYKREAGLVEIITLLAHSSSEWIRCSLDMPIAKTDAQAVGSAITYGRRYSYSAVLNVASETDDDGSAAVSKGFTKEQADESIDRAMKGKSDETSEEFDQRTEGQQCIAVFQQNAIIEACKRTGKTEEEVSAYLGLIGHKRIEHLFKSEFNDFLKWANSKGKPAASNPAKVQPKGPSPADQNRITANKKLWASAAEHSVSEADVKQYSYETYKVQSMTELTAAQLDEVTSWVEGV